MLSYHNESISLLADLYLVLWATLLISIASNGQYHTLMVEKKNGTPHAALEIWRHYFLGTSTDHHSELSKLQMGKYKHDSHAGN